METLDAAAILIIMPKLWRVRWACGAGASFSIMIAVDIDIGECGVVGDHLESVWLTEIVRLVSECSRTMKEEKSQGRKGGLNIHLGSLPNVFL